MANLSFQSHPNTKEAYLGSRSFWSLSDSANSDVQSAETAKSGREHALLSEIHVGDATEHNRSEHEKSIETTKQRKDLKLP
ncbi:hypothetical protein YC2023_076800 [Brassica napus]